MQRSSTPEFDGWRWVSFWYPVRQVVSFKRDVYRRVMKRIRRNRDAAATAVSTAAGARLSPKERLTQADYAHALARNC
ncbi:RNA pyrophosphohydrolase [Serratia rubidaea]|uniref:RNA pyrophosphohydrolase n=1 Tax=Serratia rubidaea TaxID=61652 RepID=A0A4U9HSC3_SERRU|nr:RNA pyrophosphohydrolase [Serratia rubidaea]